MSNTAEQSTNQEIWDKHAKQDNSALAARAALAKLATLESSDLNSPHAKKEFADTVRQAVILSKSAALKTPPAEASDHLQNAIKVFLGHYPVSTNEEEARKRGENWENAVIESQSAQLICLRDMLSLLDFVAKIAPSEELDNLTKQILVLLLELSEEKSSEVFALISLIEKADYKKAVEAFKVYSEKYCSPDHNFGLDQVITVSTRFLERTIKEQDPKNGIFALENLFRVFFEDKSYVKRMALDMAKAIFPGLRDKVVNKAAKDIREEVRGREKLEALVQSLLNLSHVSVGEGKVKEI
ncbi:hypothetical protein KBB59_02775 [Candidatus Woesebacteria bacterium]|jgi:hypothetical protein|nr:hypothetical protein [Candidatus Woesebacteria bacterium]HOP39312.1 hypothetical protein [Candidatus Woesebacteria bacterium]HPK08670.1 hypothetical protein [Candidatus Woesebacteria bacterium]HPR14089.1 hypothetical protein [Candidatus Woesebacteria bacterium]HQO51376.1 hypothetical protein [Candidatus Woesebacteria bacterium]